MDENQGDIANNLPDEINAAADALQNAHQEQALETHEQTGDPGTDSGESEGEKQPQSLADAMTAALDRVADAEKPAGDDKQGETSTDKPDGQGQAATAQESGEKPAATDEPDPYTPPEGLKERQAKRWDQLVAHGKQKDTQIQELSGYKEQYEQITNAITSTGAPPEEINLLLGYASAIHSGDPVKLQQAYDLITQEQQALAKMLGREAPGFDPLEEYPDLKKKVENMDVDRETALEVAKSRKMQAQHDSQRQHNAAMTEQQTAFAQEVEFGKRSLNNLQQRLMAEDPDYEEKIKIVMPLLENVARNTRPQFWGEAFAGIYRNAGASVSAMRKIQPPPASQQALTGTGMAATGNPSPKSMEEAISAGLRRAKG